MEIISCFFAYFIACVFSKWFFFYFLLLSDYHLFYSVFRFFRQRRNEEKRKKRWIKFTIRIKMNYMLNMASHFSLSISFFRCLKRFSSISLEFSFSHLKLDTDKEKLVWINQYFLSFFTLWDANEFLFQCENEVGRSDWMCSIRKEESQSDWYKYVFFFVLVFWP